MKAITFYFQNLEPDLCLYRFVLAFLPFIVDLIFGKILNVYEKITVGTYKQLAKNTNSLAHAKDSISANAQVSALKNTEQMTQKKLVITLIYKLNTSIT